MSKTRIYVVKKSDGATRLVRASTGSQAIRHCTMGEYSAKAASSDEVASAMEAGSKIETAKTETESNESTSA